MRRALPLLLLGGCFGTGGGDEGSGAAALPDAAPTERSRLEVSHASLNFGRLLPGESATAEVSLTSTGERPLRIESIQLEFGERNFSVLTGPLEDPDEDGVPGLAPGASMVLRVETRSAHDTTALGNLVIRSDDRARGEVEIALLTRFRAPTCLRVGPSRLDFEARPVGQAEELEVALSSCGPASVVLESLGVERPGAAFEVRTDAPLPMRVGPNGTRAYIRFAPPARGPFEDALTLISNDELNPSQRVQLRGEGLTNACPTAVSAEALAGVEGRILTLDGRASLDPDGQAGTPQRWFWTVIAAPEGSAALIRERFDDPRRPQDGGPEDDPTTPPAEPFTDLPGPWVVQPSVEDERTTANLDACEDTRSLTRVQVARDPLPAMEVELNWITAGLPDRRRPAGNQLDLHLLHPLTNAWFHAERDCYLDHCDLQWGAPNTSPILGEIPLGGGQRVELEQVEGGAYTIGVHYRRRFDLDGYDFGPAQARVRVRIRGNEHLDTQVRLPESGVLFDEGLMWEVVEVRFRPFEIRVLDRLAPRP